MKVPNKRPMIREYRIAQLKLNLPLAFLRDSHFLYMTKRESVRETKINNLFISFTVLFSDAKIVTFRQIAIK